MKTNNTMLRTLLESPDFHLYEDSSKNVLLLSQLISDLSWRTHTNVIIVQHYNNHEHLLIYSNGDLFNATFNPKHKYLHADPYYPVTISKEYLSSLYTIVGYWKGELS